MRQKLPKSIHKRFTKQLQSDVVISLTSLVVLPLLWILTGIYFSAGLMTNQTVGDAAYYGFWLTCVLWFFASISAHSFLVHDDHTCVLVMPLSPAVYYRRTLRRYAVPIVIFLVLLPIGQFVSAAIVSNKFHDPFWPKAHLLLNIFLTVGLCLAIPAYEILNPAWWTNIYFSPRLLVRPFIRNSCFIMIIGFIAFIIFIAKVSIKPIIAPALQNLSESGFLGKMLLYLMAPMAGVHVIHHKTSDPAYPWILSALLATALVWMIWRIKPFLKTIPRPLFLQAPILRHDERLNLIPNNDPLPAAIDYHIPCFEDACTDHTCSPAGDTDANPFSINCAREDGIFPMQETELSDAHRWYHLPYRSDLQPEQVLERFCRANDRPLPGGTIPYLFGFWIIYFAVLALVYGVLVAWWNPDSVSARHLYVSVALGVHFILSWGRLNNLNWRYQLLSALPARWFRLWRGALTFRMWLAILIHGIMAAWLCFAAQLAWWWAGVLYGMFALWHAGFTMRGPVVLPNRGRFHLRQFLANAIMVIYSIVWVAGILFALITLKPQPSRMSELILILGVGAVFFFAGHALLWAFEWKRKYRQIIEGVHKVSETDDQFV